MKQGDKEGIVLNGNIEEKELKAQLLKEKATCVASKQPGSLFPLYLRIYSEWLSYHRHLVYNIKLAIYKFFNLKNFLLHSSYGAEIAETNLTSIVSRKPTKKIINFGSFVPKIII